MSIVLPCTENVVDDEDTRDETFLVTNLTTKMSTFQRQNQITTTISRTLPETKAMSLCYLARG
jgi:hypothetical protein